MVIYMSIFDKLKAYQANATLPDTSGSQAQSSRPALMPPEKAPATMTCFPPDFHRYDYAGMAIEKVPSLSADGTPSYQRALVARMLRREETAPDYEGNAASIAIEMTASLRDLTNSRHPQAPQITKALCDYYDDKVYNPQSAETNKLGQQTKPQATDQKPKVGLVVSTKFKPFG